MGSFGMLARRALETESPVMVQIQELYRSINGATSLAQGVVHWQPPKQALTKVKELVFEPKISCYGADEGIPELRNALMQKLHKENKLNKSKIMVTAGANQAFVNLVLTLCDAGDSVIMFAPYYFNAYMSFQMTGVNNILVGPGDPKSLYPDADWLEQTLKKSNPPPKIVSVVNPGNPSGTYIPKPLLQAYGMMGWRVGYIAYPSGVDGFLDQLLKVQDNIPICASIISQYLAMFSLEVGTDWVKDRVNNLVKNRDIVREALSALGEDSVKGGEGAIYLWAKLPDEFRPDFEIVRWLARRHRVILIPGSACGCPGHLRVSFGGLPEADTAVAAERLQKGLEELLRYGMKE